MVNHTYKVPTVSTEEAGWAWVRLFWTPQGTGVGLLSPAVWAQPSTHLLSCIKLPGPGWERLRRLAQGVLEAQPRRGVAARSAQAD